MGWTLASALASAAWWSPTASSFLQFFFLLSLAAPWCKPLCCSTSGGCGFLLSRSSDRLFFKIECWSCRSKVGLRGTLPSCLLHRVSGRYLGACEAAILWNLVNLPHRLRIQYCLSPCLYLLRVENLLALIGDSLLAAHPWTSVSGANLTLCFFGRDQFHLDYHPPHHTSSSCRIHSSGCSGHQGTANPRQLSHQEVSSAAIDFLISSCSSWM